MTTLSSVSENKSNTGSKSNLIINPHGCERFIEHSEH